MKVHFVEEIYKADIAQAVIKGTTCKNCKWFCKAKHRLCSGYCSGHRTKVGYSNTCSFFERDTPQG